jgi:hypothetical protein
MNHAEKDFFMKNYY